MENVLHPAVYIIMYYVRDQYCKTGHRLSISLKITNIVYAPTAIYRLRTSSYLSFAQQRIPVRNNHISFAHQHNSRLVGRYKQIFELCEFLCKGRLVKYE